MRNVDVILFNCVFNSDLSGEHMTDEYLSLRNEKRPRCQSATDPRDMAVWTPNSKASVL